jgi:hypothetical protein
MDRNRVWLMTAALLLAVLLGVLVFVTVVMPKLGL